MDAATIISVHFGRHQPRRSDVHRWAIPHNECYAITKPGCCLVGQAEGNQYWSALPSPVRRPSWAGTTAEWKGGGGAWEKRRPCGRHPPFANGRSPDQRTQDEAQPGDPGPHERAVNHLSVADGAIAWPP